MVILFVVVGESCGCLRMPAAESSIHELRAFAVKASNGGLVQTLQKMKILGVKRSGITDAE